MSVRVNAKSNRHRKTYAVEPDGPGRKYMFLLGEILLVRAGKKSAEAIVVLRPAERQEERRAEASRKKRSLALGTGGAQVFEMLRCDNCGRCQGSRTRRGEWILAAEGWMNTESPNPANKDARSASMELHGTKRWIWKRY